MSTVKITPEKIEAAVARVQDIIVGQTDESRLWAEMLAPSIVRATLQCVGVSKESFDAMCPQFS